MAAGGGVLPANIDADDANNYAPNTLAGFNVNSIVLEVPISMLTADGNMHQASEKSAAVIGTWGTTSRQNITVLRSAPPAAQFRDVEVLLNTVGFGGYSQVQRLGNPLINELIIGTGSKDTFSMSAAQGRLLNLRPSC